MDLCIYRVIHAHTHTHTHTHTHIYIYIYIYIYIHTHIKQQGDYACKTHPNSFSKLCLIDEVVEVGDEEAWRGLVTVATNDVWPTVTLSCLLVTLVVIGTTNVTVAWLASLDVVPKTPVLWLEGGRENVNLHERRPNNNNNTAKHY